MPDESYRIANLEGRMAAAEAEIATLKGHRLPDAPAGDYGDEIAEIRNEMSAQGWTQFPTNSTLAGALAFGVPASVIVEHFGKVYDKLPNDPSHLVNILRLDTTLYPYLLDGTGIGYVPWLATPAEQEKLFGYTQADVDAASTANPEKYIDDYPLFVSSGGTQGFYLRKKDANGYYL